MKVFAITINTFREAVRNKILYSVIFFAIFLVAIAALFGSVTIGDQAKVIKDFGLFSLSFFGAVITILSGGSLLNKELKQKTVYNILSKPVKRWQFVLGKHLGLTLTVSVLVSMMGIGVMLFVAIFEGHIDWLILQGIVFAILEVTVVAAVAMFFSSLVVTTTLSGLFTFATYIAGRSITYFKFFLEKDENYNPALASVVRFFDWVLPDLSLFNFNDSLVYGKAATFNDFGLALAYCIGYSAVAIIFAALIFQKRELN